MSGKNFSPRYIQGITAFEFSYQHENGETKELNDGGTLLMDSGVASLKAESDGIDDWDKSIDNFLSLMETWRSTLTLNGLESLILQIDILYISQCNIALDSSILSRLHLLGASLAVSAYRV